jgi:8-amino-7-oxononanoate synthase
MLNDELEQALQERQREHRYRQRLVLESAQSSRIMVEGREYLAFCSNDYLGLANHPQVIAALQQAASLVGVGSGASHLVCGHSTYHHQLEERLAVFTGRERALLFSTGYMANLAVIAALAGRGDHVFEDRLNHASLIDGGLLSRAHFSRFRHNDMAHLSAQLTKVKSGRKLVVVDGVFSMDGDIAALAELAVLCEQQQAVLMVDDAHGFGVLGQHGGGCVEHLRLSQEDVPILVGTFGKAFGTCGAFVAGSDALIETLIQFARPYIYTTALPPSIAAASLASLDLLSTEQWRRQHLQQRIAQFCDGARSLALPLMVSATPIQPLVLGSDSDVLLVANGLRDQGVLVGAIRPPTVPEGTARLRITLSAVHTESDIVQLLHLLDKTVPNRLRRS